MNIDWSFHAQDQLTGILRTIAFKLSYDDAVRWRLKINGDLAPLADFPESCPNIPPECFYEIPPLVNRLRQLHSHVVVGHGVVLSFLDDG